MSFSVQSSEGISSSSSFASAPPPLASQALLGNKYQGRLTEIQQGAHQKPVSIDSLTSLPQVLFSLMTKNLSVSESSSLARLNCVSCHYITEEKRKIHHLNVAKSSINDEGLVVALSQFPAITSIDLRVCRNITAAGLEQLKAANIERNGTITNFLLPTFVDFTTKVPRELLSCISEYLSVKESALLQQVNNRAHAHILFARKLRHFANDAFFVQAIKYPYLKNNKDW